MASGLHYLSLLIKFSRNPYHHTRFGFVNKSRNFTFHTIKDIHLSKDAVGSKAIIKGWVKAVRKMKENHFLDVDDGSWSSKLQVVVPKETVPKDLTYGSSIETIGQLVLNPQKQVELIPEKINVIGPCIVTDGFPFAPRKLYPPDYIRQYLHLRPRTQSFSSLLRVRHCAIEALNQFFSDSGFCKIDVPVLTSNDCEGAGEVFLVKPESQKVMREMSSPDRTPDEAFFNGKAYLSVSGQFHLEVVARAMSKVFCFGPTFRAENSKSRLHLAEFYMAEAEIAFVNNLEDVLTTIEGLIKHISKHLMDVCANDIHYFIKSQDTAKSFNIDKIISSSFTVDTYDSVSNVLETHSSQLAVPFKKGEPLSKEHEIFLAKLNSNIPLFVVEWPEKIKPFYMKGHPSDPSKVLAVDLLCPNVGELCGGSLREDSYATLETKLRNNNLEDKLAWYLELRKFGNVSTGGFGMGFERFLQFILGIHNIKDTIPFPRYPHNCKL